MRKEFTDLRIKMHLRKDFRNELMKRREVEFVFESEKNPGFETARKKVVEKFKVGEENVAIKFVKNNFGTHEFFVEAFVYDSLQDKNETEPKVKPKKTKGGA